MRCSDQVFQRDVNGKWVNFEVHTALLFEWHGL